MKKLSIVSALALALILSGFSQKNYKAQTATEGIQWYSFEEGVAKADKEKKKIVVDFYTTWCGWCKRMDKDTYANANVVEEMNKNFVAIKFNAEGRDTIKFNGKTYTYSAQYRSHQLAYILLKGYLAYPTTVVLNEKAETIGVLPGYRNASDFQKTLLYYSSNAYKEKN